MIGRKLIPRIPSAQELVRSQVEKVRKDLEGGGSGSGSGGDAAKAQKARHARLLLLQD